MNSQIPEFRVIRVWW